VAQLGLEVLLHGMHDLVDPFDADLAVVLVRIR